MARCRACGQPIEFRRTAAGKLAPFEVGRDGSRTDINHFTTCPEAKSFSKKNSKRDEAEPAHRLHPGAPIVVQG